MNNDTTAPSVILQYARLSFARDAALAASVGMPTTPRADATEADWSEYAEAMRDYQRRQVAFSEAHASVSTFLREHREELEATLAEVTT